MDYNNVILVLQSMYKKSTHMVGGSLKGGFINPKQNENKAINLAIEALEKQRPKKIQGESVKVKALDVETEKVVFFKCLPCPTCEKWETANSKYCRSCGQKLDWS